MEQEVSLASFPLRLLYGLPHYLVNGQHVLNMRPRADIADLELVNTLSKGKVDLTFGS